MRRSFGFREDSASAVLAGMCLDSMGHSRANLLNTNEPSYRGVSTGLSQAFIPKNLCGPYLTLVSSGTALIVDSYFMPTYQPSKSEQLDSWTATLEELYASLERDYKKILVERLKFLAEVSEDPHDPVMSYGSLKHFISYIKAHKLSRPELVLSAVGNVRAEWRPDRAHHFAAEFLPDGLVKFVVFVQSENDQKKIERVAGITSLKKLWDFMVTTEANWCFE